MRISAGAPGKAVLLGEYAVLTGAPALVLAIDRRCAVELEPVAGPASELCMVAPQRAELSFQRPAASGVALVDLVLGHLAGSAEPPPWRAVLDSRAFFSGANKLGVGSSAAVLCAWAGAYTGYLQQAGIAAAPLGLEALVALHRAFQGGRGSGLDVAASLRGGLIHYELGPDAAPRASSVPLPIGVAFAGIFAGRSASTADFVGRFGAWRQAQPHQAASWLARLATVARAGLAAAASSQASVLLEAVAAYGRELEGLGVAMGTEIVTAEHREIGREAERYGVIYKVSGAGGGDLGLAMSADSTALNALKNAIAAKGYWAVDLKPDEQGLVVVEEQAG